MRTPFQLDRTVTLRVIRPLRRFFKTGNADRFAILMYHGISDIVEKTSNPYYRLRTTPSQFEAQLAFLRSNGYRVMPLQQGAEQFLAGALRGRAVSITFDDGLRDFYTNAFPLLRKYGFASTVFLPIDYISRNDLHLKGEEHLTWEQIHGLSEAGVCFGSHTLTHRRLDLLPQSDLEHELRASRQILEYRLGTIGPLFSYPFAFPEAKKEFIVALRKLLVQSGYAVGVTTKIGTVKPGQDPLFLPRIPINSSDDLPIFLAKLEGDYNWLHGVQYAAKWAKQRFAA